MLSEILFPFPINRTLLKQPPNIRLNLHSAEHPSQTQPCGKGCWDTTVFHWQSPLLFVTQQLGLRAKFCTVPVLIQCEWEWLIRGKTKGFCSVFISFPFYSRWAGETIIILCILTGSTKTFWTRTYLCNCPALGEQHWFFHISLPLSLPLPTRCRSPGNLHTCPPSVLLGWGEQHWTVQTRLPAETSPCSCPGFSCEDKWSLYLYSRKLSESN